jgi:hypothetical protein
MIRNPNDCVCLGHVPGFLVGGVTQACESAMMNSDSKSGRDNFDGCIDFIEIGE